MCVVVVCVCVVCVCVCVGGVGGGESVYSPIDFLFHVASCDLSSNAVSFCKAVMATLSTGDTGLVSFLSSGSLAHRCSQL